MGVGEQLDPDTAWRAGIFGTRGDGQPVGAGILLPGQRILTCAHVVAVALGVSDGGPAPSAPVFVGFAGAKGGVTCPAYVQPGGWIPARDDRGDVAVLELAEPPPPEARPAPLGRCDVADDHPVKAFGYPDAMPGGLWAESRVIGRGGSDPNWVQLDGIRLTGGRIESGYSGAGVWDPLAGRVIGMVVAEFRPPDAKVSWMLPTEALASYWPPLRQLVRSAYAAKRLSIAGLGELADALLSIPFMVQPTERAELVGRLRPSLAAAVPHSPRARSDVLNLLQTCQDYPGGLAELVDAVRLIDPDSEPSRHFQAVATRLNGEQDQAD